MNPAKSSKVYIVILAIVFLAVIIGGLFLQRSYLNKFAEGNCAKFIGFAASDDCGYVKSDMQGKVHYLLGKVVKVTPSKLSVFFKTNGRSFVQSFSIYDLISKINVTQVTDSDFNTDPIDWNSKLVNQFTDSQLKTGDIVIVTVDIMTKTDLPNIEQDLTKKELECFGYKVQLLDFLKEYKFEKQIDLYKWEYLKRCLVPITQIYY